MKYDNNSMLIQFSIRNFRSIKDSAVLSLVKGAGDEHEATHATKDLATGMELLRGAVVYGPNAAGKSNLIKAVAAMKDVVTGSVQKQRGDALDVAPYLFDPDTANAPTEFEVIFVHDNIRYQYGFAATRTRIIEEWLFAYPKGRAQRWFARRYDQGEGIYHWELGEKLQGKKQVWVEATRENALFLSTAVQLNSEQLRTVYDWFDKKLTVFSAGKVSEAYTARRSKADDEMRKRVLMFLHAADLDIVNFEIEEKVSTFSKFSDIFDPSMLRDFVEGIGEGNRIFRVKSYHKSTDGTVVPISLKEESDGTQKIFALAAHFCNILSHGKVLFADELSENLHPSVFKFLISLFLDPEMNTGNAQIVFTTHDTSILSQTFLRRDQIWFVDKNRNKFTELYPLSDYMPRKGHENLKDQYLGGAYRAIPLIRRENMKNMRALEGAHNKIEGNERAVNQNLQRVFCEIKRIKRH